MNNTQIIEQAAVESGFFTKEEVEQLSSEGKPIPFYTQTTWKKKGYIPKEGINGYKAILWKKKPSARVDTGTVEDNLSGSFYKVQCHLFHSSQVMEADDSKSGEH